MIQIVETLGRTDYGNGVSRPYRCLGDDGRLYYVKTASMGIDQMIKDWLGCLLAKELGLPVATAEFVLVPEDLTAGQAELSAGVCFGSREVQCSVHCTTHYLQRCDSAMASKILLFDRWTRNNDRSFSPLGGNPNLLYLPAASSLVMIDEDNAFDREFEPEQFWQGHGLRDFRAAFLPEMRDEMLAWLHTGLKAVSELWERIPEQWLMRDDGECRTTLALDEIVGMLSQFTEDPDFWALP